MDGATVVDRVRGDNETALDRLGSERALVAVTNATIDRATVLESSAAAEARAAATFDAWADDEDVAVAREAFAAAADRERDHLERVAALADADLVDRDPDPDALHDHLRGLEGAVERVGAGMIGRPLVASRTLLQVINFFVNEGESTAAETFRELRAETDEQASAGGDLVVEVCEGEDSPNGDGADGLERARAAADEAIDVAYEEYADQLSAMGVDPKPVC